MAIWELFKSRAGSVTEQTRMYAMDGADGADEDAAMAALQATAPIAAGALLLDDQSLAVEPVGPELWTGTATYKAIPKRKPLQPADGVKISFNTGGGSTKIYQSKESLRAYTSAGLVTTAPNHKGAINVTQDGEVQGVEIPIRKFTFKLRKVFEVADVDNAYIDTLYNLTATANNADFYGFGPKEVLFLGVEGDNMRGDGKFDFSFVFEASKSVTGLTVGDVISIDKKGQEYIWFSFSKTVGGTPPRTVAKSDTAYIERVFDYTDFADLGLGTSLIL